MIGSTEELLRSNEMFGEGYKNILFGDCSMSDAFEKNEAVLEITIESWWRQTLILQIPRKLLKLLGHAHPGERQISLKS